MNLEKIVEMLKDHESRIKKLEQKKNDKGKEKDHQDSSESILSYLMELKTEGFFKTPKFLQEIITELGRRGHHYNRTSMSKPLLEAVRQKKLGRIGKPRKWQYVNR